MLVPNRHGSSNKYRYGFNGKEKDDELKGCGNSLDFGARMLDSRVGRFFAVDPKTSEYANLSPYAYAGNNPIYLIDFNGEGPLPSFVGIPVTRDLFIKIVKANGFELKRREGESNDNYGRRYTVTLGGLFEKNVLTVLGLKKNTQHIKPYKYNNEYVIPDAVETSRYQKISKEKMFGIKYNKVKYALDFDNGLFFEAKFSKNIMFEQEFNPLQFKKQIDALASVDKATKYTESGSQVVDAKATSYQAAVLIIITPSDAAIDQKLIDYATEKKVILIRQNLEFNENKSVIETITGGDTGEIKLKGGSFSLSKGEYLNPEVIKSQAGTRDQGSRQLGDSKPVIPN